MFGIGEPTVGQSSTETPEVENMYSEKFVKSFPDAIEAIKKDVYDANMETDASKICLVDVDGTLITDNRVKLPFITHFVKPNIEDETVKAFDDLILMFGGNVAIYTNRSENEKLIFGSHRVFREVNSLIYKTGGRTQIFSSLFKQNPNWSREDISKEYLPKEVKKESGIKRMMKPKIDFLVQFIAKTMVDKIENRSNKKPTINLYAIEDWSIVSLNRDFALKEMARKLKEEYGYDIRITNYVIKM